MLDATKLDEESEENADSTLNKPVARQQSLCITVGGRAFEYGQSNSADPINVVGDAVTLRGHNTWILYTDNETVPTAAIVTRNTVLMMNNDDDQ